MKNTLFLYVAVLLMMFSCKTKNNTSTSSGTDSSKSGNSIKDPSKSNPGSSSTWVSKDREDFLQTCLDKYSHSLAQCKCMQEAIEAKYADVKQVAALSDADVKSFGTNCNAEGDAGGFDKSKDNNGVSLWTDKERKAFVETCSNSAAGLGARAKSYCECSLEQLEKLYPNPLDVTKLTDEETESIAKDCLKQ